MEKEHLLKKWLNDELNSEELEAFHKLEDASLYQEIIQESKRFKASDQYTVDDFEKFKSQKENHTKTPSSVIPLHWTKMVSSIAAVMLIALGIYYVFTSNAATTITTEFAQKELLDLPDQSQVVLNAKSSIRYKEKTWEEKREVSLDGEAFFNVAKGSKFDVLTDDGIVSVLGTSFNVKQRDQFFEVTCYEGLVSVTYQAKTIQLPAGTSFRLDHNKESHSKITIDAPQWIANRSVFSKVTVLEVFKELERQFDVSIDSDQIDNTILFSGGFEHTDLTDALTQITAPLRLEFKIENNKKVVIYDATH
ncbi:anti-sigma factor [Dokdonia pacifica]|uniref:FecR family protein n=1 Tax=Dokdonia pacifica TaxID=1627892 RepID=A0A238ZIC7_9FLAO|nr:FecR family protein [Dokdonia pacifica]GGG06620.1 anti-sigma factor [Dokdonia pacifica]SNR82902.1 FecR family protein [Dokdonia pacifica]